MTDARHAAPGEEDGVARRLSLLDRHLTQGRYEKLGEVFRDRRILGPAEVSSSAAPSGVGTAKDAVETDRGVSR